MGVTKMDKETIEVLVRPAPHDDNARVISFPYPERVAVSEWRGFDIPIAGGEVTSPVGRNEGGQSHSPALQRGAGGTVDWAAGRDPLLAAAEKSLIEFLGGRDYEVRF